MHVQIMISILCLGTTVCESDRYGDKLLYGLPARERNNCDILLQKHCQL